MRTGDNGVAVLDLAQRAAQHFMRHGVGEQNQQIGRADAAFQAVLHLSENLGLTAILAAKVFVLADHAVISADDNNAHSSFSCL